MTNNIYSKQRIFAIGDIHGEYDKLQNLMFILAQHHCLDLAKDKIVFMGDMIDRGPDSFKVLKYVRKLQQEHPKNVIALYGNHEDLMVKWHNGTDKWDLWGMNGGDATRKSFKKSYFYKDEGAECPPILLEWVQSLPLSHKEKGFFFSHAPIPQDDYRRFLDKGRGFTKDELIWSFSKEVPEDYYARVHDRGVIGVCGHVHALSRHVYDVRLYPHYIFTDAGCGCAKGAPLCAVEVRSRQVVYSV